MLESWKDRKAKAVPAMLLFCAKMHIQLYRNLKFYKSVYGDGLRVPLNLYAFIWILHCIRFHAGQAHRAPTGINLQNAPLWQCARCAPRKLGPESRGESSFSFFSSLSRSMRPISPFFCGEAPSAFARRKIGGQRIQKTRRKTKVLYVSRMNTRCC